jgi:hypothetical protein
MPSNNSGLEGTALAFFMTLTVLLGVSYVLGIAYRLTIPWLLILAVSALVAFALRFRRRP